jgi:hypothetical protein
MIRPNDLGEIVENCQKIKIDDFVRQVNKRLKKELLKSSIEALGADLLLTTSKTRFNGARYWFLCPLCNKRRGVLYSRNNQIACRVCLGLKYRKQRYKGMTELVARDH